MIEILLPLLGGITIGIAAVLMMLTLGRITGVSGILFGLFPNKAAKNDKGWRWCFVAGLVVAPLLLMTITNFQGPAPPSGGLLLAVVSGMIVGFGTTLGKGCTSGHGVCGMARLSTRSIVATVIFITTGIITATIVRML